MVPLKMLQGFKVYLIYSNGAKTTSFKENTLSCAVKSVRFAPTCTLSCLRKWSLSPAIEVV